MTKVFSALAALMLMFAVAAPAHAVSLAEFDHLDPHNIVPDRPLREAVTYFKLHENQFSNRNYIVVIDYSQPSNHKRMYVINMKTGQVEAHLVANGKGSDKNKDGMAEKFSNAGSSHASSLGPFRTAEIYFGKHGKSLRLDGLSSSNSNARARAVVVHGARYVNERSSRAGRSWGCPAVDPSVINPLIAKIKDGALIYSWDK